MSKPKIQKSPSEIYGPTDCTGVRGRFKNRHWKFGFYDAFNKPVPNCTIEGDLCSSSPERNPSFAPPKSKLDQPVLFAGLAPEQFGHVILNSLGRLWALEHLPRDTALLFMPRKKVDPSLYPYLRPVVDLLCPNRSIIFHPENTRYVNLYTAPDLFGERHAGRMLPAMRQWLKQKLPPSGPVSKGRRVYFTRSRMGPSVGRFCNEPLLEHLLIADGYEVIAPERLTLAEQIAIMQDAELMLFAESSALHLFGLVQRKGQKAGVILRRRELPKLIVNQLGDGDAKIVTIDAISEIHWPPIRQDNASVAVLDFDKLRADLVKDGFVRRTAAWRAPYIGETASSLSAGIQPGMKFISEDAREDWLRTQRQKRSK